MRRQQIITRTPYYFTAVYASIEKMEQNIF